MLQNWWTSRQRVRPKEYGGEGGEGHYVAQGVYETMLVGVVQVVELRRYEVG